MATKRATKKTNKPEQRLIAYKGFDRNLVCNPTGDKPFQYEIGKTYTTDTAIVRCAAGGFHSCEFPLDVFGYYAPGDSRYCEVEASGTIARDYSDTKVASAEITIRAELKLPDLIDRAIKRLLANIEDSKKEHSTGDRSAASSTGYQSAASSTGHQSAASSRGDRSAASSTGYQSAASSTGHQSAASSTGDRSAASSTGDRSAASSTGHQSAASSTGCQSAASSTGYQSAASSTGHQSAASSTGYESAASSTGHRSAAEASGKHVVACGLGSETRARASKTGAIVLCNRDPYSGAIRHIRASKVGENGIKPDVWYSLDDNGEFVEA